MKRGVVRERVIDAWRANPYALHDEIARRAECTQGYVSTVLLSIGIRRKPPQVLRRETALQRKFRLLAADREYHSRRYANDGRYAEMARLRAARNTARKTLARRIARNAPAAEIRQTEDRIADLTRQIDKIRIRPARAASGKAASAQRAAKAASTKNQKLKTENSNRGTR